VIRMDYLTNAELAFLAYASEAEYDSMKDGDGAYRKGFLEVAEQVRTLLKQEYKARNLTWEMWQAEAKDEAIRKIVEDAVGCHQMKSKLEQIKEILKGNDSVSK
jgi:hypothetical protein